MTRESSYFKKGNNANPGGRPKGAKNKVKYEVAQILSDLNYCPFTHLYKMAMDENWGDRERTRAACELAGYVAPKLKAIEISSEDFKEGFNMIFNVNKEKGTDAVDNLQCNEDSKPISS
jgi:hypothetical protein